MSRPSELSRNTSADRPLRIAIFDNLANNAYTQAKVLHRAGQSVDLVLDPLDRYVMSDPRWEDLDIELPTDQLVNPELPACDLPEWVRIEPTAFKHRDGGRIERNLGPLRAIPATWPAAWLAARRAGWRGARMVLDRAWVVRTLTSYDCVIAYGMGPAWAAVAGVPFVAETWGGDVTMLPFYDTGDWEGHENAALPGPKNELFAQARLQRMGYERAARIILTDPRFFPFAERLGHADKSVHLGFMIDTERYSPGPEPDLRAKLLRGHDDGVIVFVPSRQDWYWKGSDRLLRGFAAAASGGVDAALVCAGWGVDLERSERLIAELGIGERVHLLPYALSKARLLRYYRAADIVADQFTVGSYGASALEAMSCGRPLLISLEPQRFEGRFPSFPPVMNVSEPEQIAAAFTRLFADGGLRSQLGAKARNWVVENHGQALARRVLELCGAAVDEAPARRHADAR
jgi:glycosyltransferase involved in cell wall biosynthesis